MSFTLEQVLALSPDDASAKAAKGLVAPAKWPTLGQNAQALWGECQGSGSKPYQTQVDRNGPAFRCSCPSRKFPCKHGLALLLLSVQHTDKFLADAAAPAWVAEWLASRGQRAAQQEAKAQVRQQEAVADPEAQARREAKRLDRIAAGVDELERWLQDQLRHGLARLETAPADTWNTLAARMVDSQAGGLAAKVRGLAAVAGQPGDWPTQLLARMGRLQLLLDAMRRLPALVAARQADVQTALGMAPTREEVLAQGEKIRDVWAVVGLDLDERDKLWERRVWLHGQASDRFALLLDFAHGAPRFAESWLVGSTVGATLAFFPGALPGRALLADTAALVTAPAPVFPALTAALQSLADCVAANPWQESLPLALAGVVPVLHGGHWFAATGAGEGLPLQLGEAEAWALMAQAGGEPLQLFGEWDGAVLRPLSAWRERLLWAAGGRA